ncbi:hypothetical protein [Pseudemcibacter aquimaris]|uniref:hypothetical protein n=1 Tax=Pseudemcibacter aquimaris TaxID=2857064 RepID=UPI002011332B|nr:hypothetical protein [Pseudemcibacter aquimaris]MCC3859770.1 hypothetical protein [Pseudemcibacter aquimaris]WDU60164.1 hypothetical protein KW060_07825 [Pseudemcibacter aquimaris]
MTMPPETNTNQSSYESTSFFGNILDRVTDLGGQYLQFDWMKYQYDTEAALAGQYAQATSDQRYAERQDLAATRSDNLIKYGVLAVVAVVAGVALMKAVK